MVAKHRGATHQFAELPIPPDRPHHACTMSLGPAEHKSSRAFCTNCAGSHCKGPESIAFVLQPTPPTTLHNARKQEHSEIVPLRQRLATPVPTLNRLHMGNVSSVNLLEIDQQLRIAFFQDHHRAGHTALSTEQIILKHHLERVFHRCSSGHSISMKSGRVSDIPT